MLAPTTKLYHRDPFLSECDGVIIDVDEHSGIACDQTVAFPEGGGQDGDRGTILVQAESGITQIPFADTRKGLGRVVFLKDFPNVQVDTPVYHVVPKELLGGLAPGMRVRMQIDVERRARLTVNHSALHLVLMGIERVRPGFSRSICGCHISTDSARLDFVADQRFSASELESIAAFVTEIVERDAPIDVFPHPDEPEAWYWRCQDVTIPCGGTHALSTGWIGPIRIKRKSTGRHVERIYVETTHPALPLELYHGAAGR